MTVKKNTADNQPQAQSTPDQERNKGGLEYLYRTIGIEAVAASVRYSGADRKPSEQRAASQIDQRFIESAV